MTVSEFPRLNHGVFAGDPANIFKILENSISRQAETYKRVLEVKRQFLAEFKRRAPLVDFSALRRAGLHDVAEDRLVYPVTPEKVFGLKIASVDGGLQTRVFSDFQFVLSRAVGGIFTFHASRRPEVRYYPHSSQNFRVEVIQRPLTARGLDFNASIERAFMEVELLNVMLEKDPGIDLVILDGSILVEPLDVFFREDHALIARYNELLREYFKLYRTCLRENVLVAGCVKDSRSKRLTRILLEAFPLLLQRDATLHPLLEFNYRDILAYFRDGDFCQYLLDHGQRTGAFQYSSDKYNVTGEARFKNLLSRLPINFYAMYAKFAEYDEPLRVEFFAKEDDAKIHHKAGLIAALLYPLASRHRQYAIPIPQIEVHRRAKISPAEMELFVNQFLQHLDPRDAMRLRGPRRSRRPFK